MTEEEREDKSINESLKRVNNALTFFIGCAISFCLGLWSMSEYDKRNITPPVEEIIAADSIIKVNDSIKIKIEKLDSIKDAKVIEVQTLDNDSTVKLFYQLIRK